MKGPKRRTRTGIQKRTADSPPTVSSSADKLVSAPADLADTEAPSAADPPADPFSATEKTIDQQTWAKTKTSRITELADESDKLSFDPYAVSTSLRRKFREEKKVMLEKQGRDEGLREKYGLHEEVDLGEEDVEDGRARWEAGRERRGLPVEEEAEGSLAGAAGTPVVSARRHGKGRASDASTGASPSLAQVLRKSTKRKYDPFADAADAFLASASGTTGVRRIPGMPKRGRTEDPERTGATPAKMVSKGKGVVPILGVVGGLLAGYGSD